MFRSINKMLAGVAAFAALALGASAIAGAASSSSTSTNTSTTVAGTPPPGAPSTSGSAPPAFKGPAHGTAAHEDAETAVTGEAATKAQAAAVKSVGSGTAGAVTSDYMKRGYEVTVTKSDGSKAEVHLDSSFNAMTPPSGYGAAGSPGRPSGSPPAATG